MEPVIVFSDTRRAPEDNPLPGRIVLLLTSDSWNDYGYVTSSPATLYIEEDSFSIGVIRLLFEDVVDSRTVYRDGDKLGSTLYRIDFEGRTFLSLAAGLEFYRRLKGLLGNEAITLLTKLHDA